MHSNRMMMMVEMPPACCRSGHRVNALRDFMCRPISPVRNMQAAVSLQRELDSLGPETSTINPTEVSYTSSAITQGIRVEATR